MSSSPTGGASTSDDLAVAAGARVEIRDEEWIVRALQPERSGGTAVHVTGVSELVRDREAIFLTKLDEIRVLAPEDTALVMDRSSKYAHTRLTLEALLRRTPPTDERIHLAHTAAIDAADYQLRPTTRALKLLRPRFLMADGVGLGKTIEVGALLTELIHRGRGRRILVVCMKSILAQFQKELWSRFTIPLVRLDSVGIRRVAAQIPSNMNPFHVFDRVIISLDTLKNARYQRYLESCRFDAIVIDECQNVAMRTKSHHGAASQRYRLARLLAKQCDALLMTSATPHDGSPRSFASIVRLLEPTAIADDEEYTKDEVTPYVQRYFKRDVAHEVRDVFPERETEHQHVAATTAERAVYDALGEARFQTIQRRPRAAALFDDARLAKGGTLFSTTLLKAFLSSPEALRSTLDERLRHDAVREDPKSPRDSDAEAAARADRKTLGDLAALCDAAGPIASTPKYKALLDRVRMVLDKSGDPRPDRIVVFAERIDTLEALRTALAKDLRLKVSTRGPRTRSSKADPIEIFHGGLRDVDQTDVVESFGSDDSPIRILLASDAAAEGINLHFECADLVHYDLPWSLITLVQRNGRIDRFGQSHVPRIRYLLTRSEDAKHAGDLRILERLVEKEEQVQRNLGDPATLMNLFDEEAEAELIAAAAQGDVAPEVALPDAEESENDFFQRIFGSGASPEREPVLTHERTSLFDSDIEFARSAFSLLADTRGLDLQRTVSWHETEAGFDLYPPADLQRRYRALPPELTRNSNRARLTTDRDLVKHSITEGRQSKEAWPEWELFWSNHPVCAWLDDQVLSALGRHEAWVVPLADGVAPDDALFLFQGVLSNGASQPVLVEWFAVPFRGPVAGEALPIDEVIRRTQFRELRANSGIGEVSPTLSALRADAVRAARDHMDAQRRKRAGAIGGNVRQGHRDLTQWRDASLQRLETEELLAAKGTGAAPAATRKRIAADRAEIEATFAERRHFVNRLRTDSTPYLRLAAVFCRADLA